MTLRVPEHIRRYLIVRATLDRASASEVVRQAIEDAIDREPLVTSEDDEGPTMTMRQALEIWDPEQLDELAEQVGS